MSINEGRKRQSNLLAHRRFKQRNWTLSHIIFHAEGEVYPDHTTDDTEYITGHESNLGSYPPSDPAKDCDAY
jgi:hypothetical protein